MNSKDALEHICRTCDHECCPYIHYEKSRCGFYGVIRKDLDRLEKLEKENQELKERYKHRAETSNDLCKAVKQYEKAFDIVTYKSVNILILKYCIAKGGGVETYNLHYSTEEPITQEDYDLLKEVLEK